MASLKESLQRQEEVHEPKHEVEARLNNLKADFEELVERVKIYTYFIDFLKEAVMERERRFLEIRAGMCRRVTLAFSNRLSQRNFNGKLR